MQTIQIVRCPNCGSPAERHHLSGRTHTQCHDCDYLLVLCAQTGRVIEAYAPGIPWGIKPTVTREAARKPHPLLNL